MNIGDIKKCSALYSEQLVRYYFDNNVTLPYV